MLLEMAGSMEDVKQVVYNYIMEENTENLFMKIFSDFCCNGCTYKSESDHDKTISSKTSSY